MPISPIPQGVYPSVTALDPKALRAKGITLVLADLDNTLAPYKVLEDRKSTRLNSSHQR